MCHTNTMLKARMTDLNYNEILLYLGHRGQEVTPDVDAQIQKGRTDVRRCAVPRLVYRRLPVSDGQIVGLSIGNPAGESADTGWGNDIREILSPCREAVLLAVTLGAEIERLIMQREVADIGDAFILDACASVAAENVCDRFEEDLRAELAAERLFLTSRFSPGYGDCPIELQKAVCEALNTSRRIGLSVTERSLLAPRKSVTAVLGIADTPQTLRKKGCEACNLFLHCTYRKRGVVCE